MISRADFDEYSRQVDAISRGASEQVAAQVLAWCRAHPDASVAEIREAAKEILSGVSQVYDEAAASLAAEWYDDLATEAGARLPAAITVSSYSSEQVDRTVRYQARVLVDGDVRGFAQSCGDLAEYAAKRSVNSTILANAARDRRRGVRFARVPTGAETCSFCLMLASRGAVYHTRKTAGEQNHFHRHCDCKIVPGFEDDPYAEVVEGYDPRAYLTMWRKSTEMEDGLVPVAQRKAVLAAMHERLVPSHSVSPLELSLTYQRGADSAWKEFKRLGKTSDAYEATVGAYLRDMGEACDAVFSGAFMAKPDGNELWAASKLASEFGDIVFRYAEYSTRNPDYLLNGAMAELKTPESRRKVTNRLVGIAKQFEPYPEERRLGIVSALHLSGDVDYIVETAQRFVDDGTLDEVIVIGADGSLQHLTKQ